MKMANCTSVAFLCLFFFLSPAVLNSAEKAAERVALLKVNKAYEKRTVIKKSTIPNAGNGLFAVTKIKKGEVIGELGGRLLTEQEYPAGNNHYVASIAECAWKESHPYKYLDSKDHGANVSRINFAPSEINGIETHFQNAKTQQLCKRPYFVFVAVREIQPGEEIWSTYGPNYGYDRFMKAPEVRDFFCGRLKIDCRQKYSYSH
jgi:SET domain-containing protein